MAKVKIVFDNDALTEFIETNDYIKAAIMGTAHDVAAEAQRTASAAEEGSGGRISGYAEAGFSVEWEPRGGKRPRANVVSNAPAEIATAAHFHTQIRDGIAHLRAALYRFTNRG